MSFLYNRALMTIATVNLSSLIEFYSQILQLKPQVYQVNIYAEFHLPTGLILALFHTRSKDLDEFHTGQKSPLSLCLQVTDLLSAIAILQSSGYDQQLDIITASHGQETYIYDPDGNRIILYQNLP